MFVAYYWLKGRKEGRKFDLTTHSTHFIYVLYYVGNIAKDNSDSQKGNSFPINVHYHTDRITHTMAFVTPVVDHWLERDTVRYMILFRCLFLCCCCLLFFFVVFCSVFCIFCLFFLFVLLCDVCCCWCCCLMGCGAGMFLFIYCCFVGSCVLF